MVQDGDMDLEGNTDLEGGSSAEHRDAVEPTDEQFATPILRRSVGTSAPMLAGMMLAVGEIIEPEKTHVEIAVEHARPVDDPTAELDFGSLPPLD